MAGQRVAADRHSCLANYVFSRIENKPFIDWWADGFGNHTPIENKAITDSGPKLQANKAINNIITEEGSAN